MSKARKLSNLDLKRMCRTCLTVSSSLRVIHSTKMSQMIQSCTSIKIAEDDGLPGSICISCFHLFTKYYTFRKRALKCDKLLRNLLTKDILNQALDEAEIQPNDVDEVVKCNEILLKVEAISTNEPPPLIPIQRTSTESDLKSKNLPKDTPPLVPLPADDLAKQEWQCNICQKEFKEKKKLIGHLKGHTVTKDLKCKICSKCYPNQSTFKIHMRTHTGERPFKCTVCNKGFVRWAGVLNHMKSHENTKPFACETCGKAFKIASNLLRHKVLHSKSMPFCCSYCGKTFSQSEHLKLHIRSHHTNEKPYLCSECGKGFINSTRLNRHMWVHSGYKPYQCEQCPKSYANCVDLKNHQRLHSVGLEEKERPYVCTFCDRRFHQPSRLQRHLNTHERPYSCTECLQSFSNKKYLEKHLLSKHNVEYVEEVVVDDFYS